MDPQQQQAPVQATESAWEYFQRGGPTMWVLLLCSVVAVAIFIERLWSLRSSRVAPRGLLSEVAELLRADKLAEALARSVGSGSTAGAIFAVVLRKAPAPEPVLREAAQEIGRREAVRLERFI